ncbi:MAG: DNA polymerase I [Clostridia bacterium]|nr:DNA polymerase I [Clostridia bacterium]
MDKLFIVDGNSLVFRAYYALPPMYNSNHTPTNAVFGFFKMLLNIIVKNTPKYLVVAFDAGKHTFRHDIYADYKGTRKPMPEELRGQLPIIKNILNEMNITSIEIPDIEADDIIGTLSKKFDIDSVLISGDRDLLQLISPHCRVWLTQKGLSEIADLDIEGLKERFGIAPYQVIEMKSIMGDAGDNIPGVRGIGEKTALKLINEYDNLDNIYQNIDKISGKAYKLLEEQKDMAYISRRLATIKTDCILDYTLDDFKYDFPFKNSVRQSFKTLEFKTALDKDEYFENDDQQGVGNVNFIHQETNDNDEKIKILNILSSKDTISVNFDEVGICLAEGEVEYQFLNLDFGNSQIYDLIKQILQNKHIEKVVYDAKVMMHLLDDYDIKLNNFYDVSLAYYILGFGDKDLLFTHLIDKYNLPKECLAVSLLKLKELSLDELTKMGMTKLYYDLELKLVQVLYDMEIVGIKVDEDTIKTLSQKYMDELKVLCKEIYALAGGEFNIKSPKQMHEVLFDRLKLQYKGKKSTNIDVLEAIQDQHPIVEKLIRHRKVIKIHSTYLEGILPYIKNGKIHTTFIQTVASTGRLSSREPNLQNIPVRSEEGKELRKLFTSSFDNGMIVSADYSQIELRLLAHFSKDENLVNAFNEGKDIHATTASRVFGVPLNEVDANMRRMAKAVNFGIIYGISEFGLSKNVHMTPKEAKDFITKYFELYPKVKKYMDESVEIAKARGYASTLLGRVRYIPELTSSTFVLKQFGERVAMNMPLQGTASDIIKMAMINVQNKIKQAKLKSKLILQIHDELIVDTCEDEVDIVSKILRQEMENVVQLSVPLTVDVNVGKSWFDAK